MFLDYIFSYKIREESCPVRDRALYAIFFMVSIK